MVHREKPRETRSEELYEARRHEARRRSARSAEYLLDDPWVKAIRDPAIRKYCIGMMTAISWHFIKSGDGETEKKRESDREAFQAGFSLLMELIDDIPQKELAIFATFLMLRGAFSLASDGGNLIQPALEKLKALWKSAETRERKSRIIAEAIARHAGPLLETHPRYTSHRVAAEICKAVNEALAQHGFALKIDAIRNRVKTYRTQPA
jgi:hypothetical protein